MCLVQHRTMLTARLVRALTGHAPVASFRQHFGFTEMDVCACGLGSETVGHVIHWCSEYKWPLTWFHPGKKGDIFSIVKFLCLNSKAFSFSDWLDIIDSEGGTLETEGRIRSALPNPQSGAKCKMWRKKAGSTLVSACFEAAVSSSGGAPLGGPFPQSGDMLYLSPVLDSVWCQLGSHGRVSSKVGRQPGSVMA